MHLEDQGGPLNVNAYPDTALSVAGSPRLSRRSFLRTVVPLPLALAATPLLAATRRVTFGLISDVHQDVMPDGVERVRAFVDAMKKANADFILQLGDFCWPHARNAAFLEAWNAFGGARYHVLGNHDMDGGFTREQTVAYYGIPGRHYTFDAGPVRGVVLDGNDPGAKAKGYKRFIGADQQAWLKNELAKANRPVLVFLHQPLDSNGVENGVEVRAILEGAGDKVLAVFSGHFHEDYALEINAIHYVQINSASYVWLPGSAARETYPAEVHKEHASLRNVAAYREPLWALVTVDLDRRELVVVGKSSEWVGPDPWERGAPEKDYPRDRNRPAISSRRIALRLPG
jgi:3',5'-cyclic-AMP phosphodiesterase